MIKKQKFGHPVETGAVTGSAQELSGPFPFGTLQQAEPLIWTYHLEPADRVYGLGESVRGTNKRGFRYISWCSDQPAQTESTESLYGAHNFLLIAGKTVFGIFFDTAGKVTFDIGWTNDDTLTVSSAENGITVYIITPSEQRNESTLTDVVRQFRALIGQSYIPPLWGFGFQQSRWGYKTADDVRTVVKGYRDAGIPLDSVCLDIDYMDQYKDFTVDEHKFPQVAQFTADMKKQGIHIIPIIDAGIKQLKGYSVYDEGIQHGYFCTDADGTPHVAGVWPGRSHFTDFLNPDARAWFGAQYEKLTKLGFEGFWNDMNEPAMFYSEKSLSDAFAKLEKLRGKNLDVNSFFEFTALSGSTLNNQDDYTLFYHKLTAPNGKTSLVRHDKVHNIYGALMTRAAAEGLRKISPARRMVLYTRASYIGAHRYGGIWTGDNCSWWSHFRQEVLMMPSLSMCGFLYSGADIGGFGCDSSRDLVLRWTAFGIFTPLMRNHSSWNTRNQECFRFEHPEDFRNIVNLRYALIPFIYSEFVKAALTGGMYFRPLSFDYPEDKTAASIEDELMLGESLLVAPVIEQNATGRFIYLPEDMTQVTWHNNTAVQQEIKKGTYFITIPLDTVVFFVRHGHIVPLCKPAEDTSHLDTAHLSFLGTGSSYDLYEDDGETRNIRLEGRIRTVTKEMAKGKGKGQRERGKTSGITM